jgi:hypothetical protein
LSQSLLLAAHTFWNLKLNMLRIDNKELLLAGQGCFLAIRGVEANQ